MRPELTRRKKFDFPLLPVVKEWRTKNLIFHKSVNMSIPGLLVGMNDPTDGVRAAATSAIGMVIAGEIPDESDIRALVNKTEQLLR